MTPFIQLFLDLHKRPDSVLGTRDSAEERRGWVLRPWTPAWGEAGGNEGRGMRIDTGAEALFSQVLFPPSIILVFGLRTFRAGRCPFHPIHSSPLP